MESPVATETECLPHRNPAAKGDTVAAGAHSTCESSSGRGKRKESRKFVPHEPYKAAVAPVLPMIQKTGVHSRPKCMTSFASSLGMCGGGMEDVVAERIVRLGEIPSGHRVWAIERQRLEDEVDMLKRDKVTLENQLQMQTQVNSELKKLLVASVGEDMETKVEFLTQDKAKLAHDIVSYSQRLMEDTEHLEKLSIQCDVWRSKFLASSLMVDELASWKAVLSYQLDEAIEIIKILLDESNKVHSRTRNTLRYLHLIIENDGVPAMDHSTFSVHYGNGLEDAATCEKLSETMCHKLVHSDSKLPPKVCPNTADNRTRGESLAHQVLVNSNPFDLLPSARGYYPSQTSLIAGHYSGISPRFHPTTRYEHLTFNCCGHCKGDIKLM